MINCCVHCISWNKTVLFDMSHVMYQTKSVTNYSDSDKLTPRSPFCPFRAIISKMWVPLNIKVYIFLNISSFRFERDATTLHSDKWFLRGVLWRHYNIMGCKNYAHHFYRCMGAKIQAYTPGKLKIIRNEPILQTVTDLKKITQIVVSELIFRCWPWYNLTLIFDLHITNTSYWCKLTFLTLSH